MDRQATGTETPAAWIISKALGDHLRVIGNRR
jgi:hypothetical protein